MMPSQLDLIDKQELGEVLGFLHNQEKQIQVQVADFILEMRVFEVLGSIDSLRYLHSQTHKQSVLAALKEPHIALGVRIFTLRRFGGAADVDAFSELLAWEVGQRKTTRPDGHPRATGGGRKKRKAARNECA